MRRLLKTRLMQTISMLAVLIVAGALVAQQGDSPTGSSTSSPGTGPKPAAKAKAKQALAITPEREAAALNFVERNHAELTELLAHLKSDQPKQYEQAIKDIFRVTERLAGIQERDPLLYELEVKLWTAQSHVQLVAARLKMTDSDSLKKDLREALAGQMDARLEVLKHQRQQAAERLAKMESDISQLEANKDKAIERQVETLARGGANRSLTKAPGAKGAKRAAEKAASGAAPKNKPAVKTVD